MNVPPPASPLSRRGLGSPPLPVAQVAGVLSRGATAQQQPQPQEQRQKPGGRGAPHGPPRAGTNSVQAARSDARRLAYMVESTVQRSGYPMPGSTLCRSSSALKFAPARCGLPAEGRERPSLLGPPAKSRPRLPPPTGRHLLRQQNAARIGKRSWPRPPPGPPCAGTTAASSCRCPSLGREPSYPSWSPVAGCPQARPGCAG